VAGLVEGEGVVRIDLLREDQVTLATGTRLGPYEIRGSLGAGGMGEVYRASDTKLKREVAIKVLPEAFARDGERMKRFEREAQVLASLNHPYIAAIYGVEEASGSRALVLELVEGPTLAERMASARIPVEEALRIALQIAQGMEAAHERAIVHRDLKPANVKLTRDGDVKILDFGLAKALDAEPLSVDQSLSPTLTHATHVGVLLGTAAYMSPEQAQGKPADRRADVWSFGVVLYEMLTGRRAFAGEGVSETLAHVLTREPDWSALPAGLPSRVRSLLMRCLTRDPRKRLQAIGEARIALEDTSAEPREGRRFLSPILAGALGLVVGGVLWSLSSRPAPSSPPSPPMRLSVDLGAHAYFDANTNDEGQGVLLSPDGAMLAFVAMSEIGDPPRLYVRRLEDLVASPLAGTEGARNPFFSPDGKWIGFFADGKLKKVAVTGGGPVALVEASAASGVWAGGTWAEDGTIVFARDRLANGLVRVSAEGGDPEVLTKLDEEAGEVSHRWPQVLPGGKAVLYTASTRAGTPRLIAQRLSGASKKTVLPTGYHGRYVPSGHIVYVREGALLAVAFDLDRLEVTGQPARAVEAVGTGTAAYSARFAFSDRGVLAYVPATARGPEARIQWVGRDSKRSPLRDVPGRYGWLRFSPDGRRLALNVRDRDQSDVWVYETERGTISRLTFDGAEALTPLIWTPDRERVTFASDRGNKGRTSLYWQRADGTRKAERLTTSENRQWPGSWHPSGKFLAFCEIRPGGFAPDVLILPMEGSESSGWKPGEPSVFLDSPWVENMPEFSPDGRWIAYMSNESGRFEIYVTPFPGPGEKRQVSSAGGRFPRWSRSRGELFYYADDDRVMTVPYRVEGNKFEAETARRWSEERLLARIYDVHPDGERLAVVTNLEKPESGNDRVVLILNFFDYLRRIAPPGKTR
jgi:serine/threonine-protein kinase